MLVTKSQHSSLWVCFFEAFWKLKAGKHTGGIGHNNIYIYNIDKPACVHFDRTFCGTNWVFEMGSNDALG